MMQKRRKPRPVDPALISVVIQGPLYRNKEPAAGIFSCIASIRKHLPGAEIVVSTWPHEDLSGVPADRFVVSEDPGPLTDISGNEINTNRMLRSTLAGIRAATRPYVMKFRSDHCMTSAALAVAGEEPTQEDHPNAPVLFDEPITTTTLYIRDPAKVPMLFHISDLVQFGRRESMLKLWDQPLISEKDLFNTRPFRNPFGNFVGYSSTRAVSEQSLMLGALRKHGIEVSLDHPCRVRSSDVCLWENILRLNFRVLDWQDSGVTFPHRFLSTGYPLRTLYTAAKIERIEPYTARGLQLRMAQIWLNKYVLNCFRPTWWIALASLTLFSTSPALARHLRSQWRRARKVVHEDSGRT
ncbi:WavE lipopolysaccharide synthesis family protein [Pseudomonas aeruginosa]|uniref:WavE lipopolysaccharide synthesis family protein n=1 Tax=Pseudomonas aeruginosa TaxID=287 RepID=UPI001FFE114C|nr:WavE lipopolysaccharide synthesis family protein [Pseudomonas aeruginosa]ELN4741032.1 hypothetical protein [Escherichia coli]